MEIDPIKLQAILEAASSAGVIDDPHEFLKDQPLEEKALEAVRLMRTALLPTKEQRRMAQLGDVMLKAMQAAGDAGLDNTVPEGQRIDKLLAAYTQLLGERDELKQVVAQLGERPVSEVVSALRERDYQSRMVKRYRQLLDFENDKVVELQNWINRLQNPMLINCVFCGAEVRRADEAVDETVRERLKRHVMYCPEHPLALMRRQFRQFVIAIEAPDTPANQVLISMAKKTLGEEDG